MEIFYIDFRTDRSRSMENTRRNFYVLRLSTSDTVRYISTILSMRIKQNSVVLGSKLAIEARTSAERSNLIRRFYTIYKRKR